ncbi:hypothetical protein ACVGOW_08795 [Pseudonocardia saturnea]
MTDEPRRPASTGGQMESEQVFDDDLLVEAARSGWLRDDAPDPLARILATLHECATGSCSCASRDRCPIRRAERA